MPDIAHEWTDEEIRKLRRKFRRTYERAADEMRKKLDAYLEEFERSNGEWKKALDAGDVTVKQYNAWLKTQSMRKEYLVDMADSLAWDAAHTNRLVTDMINDELPRVYAENANYAAYGIESHYGKTHMFDLYDQDTVRRIMGMTDDDQIIHEVIPYGPVPPDKELLQSVRVRPDLVKHVAWNRQKFTSSIAQSILQGESIPNTAKRLNAVLNMDEAMAVRAARTAMTSAENAGRTDSYRRAKSLGIELEQEWLATTDERTRETHRLLDGQHVPVGKRFCPHGYGQEYSIRFPADPTARGDMIWNCRCTLVAWFPEDGEESLDDRWSDLPAGMTYEQWKHSKPKSVGTIAKEKKAKNGKSG